MKQAQCLILITIDIGACLLSGCGRSQNPSSDSSNTTVQNTTLAKQDTNGWNQEEYQQSKDEALAYGKKIYEERINNPPKNEIYLPNFPAGPGLPVPIGVNFYEIHDDYPTYLLCTYDVEENHYDPSNEPSWFKTALLQIRGTGSGRFPPVKWVAVIIFNRAGYKGAGMYEEAHKVGAVFDIKDVFDPSHDPAQLIAQAQMDHHPFMYDPHASIPWQQDHWLIVERHAATIGSTNAAHADQR